MILRNEMVIHRAKGVVDKKLNAVVYFIKS